ncbi:DUF2301 domain-containing membrane protein [Spirulina sp. 06S082]|uniref:DUF2301 domain-containing membrane protein n=1 Tax=Spirulina sp. 06S082 TaxID=3110248 RepID=UPI002B221962|nr:DUF2301 domain-containing membrane protein [Spirulina sp. 06S082]MEA5468123.1 DUF2301 domain-containing membrane protein [Spirulina sp. 06S082]
MVTASQSTETVIYQGQFGEFTITDRDRQGVIIYRSGLAVAALSFLLGTSLLLWQGATPFVLNILTVLFAFFALGLGTSLLTIHIYLVPLHRLLQMFWLVGTVFSTAIAFSSPEPLALFVYKHPLTLLGTGFIFAALTGIYFKEAFCFNRLETKLLTPLVPILLLGFMAGIFPSEIQQLFLASWSILFAVFALRKVFQAIPPDIGDKSVFSYLENQKQQN